MKTSQEMVKLSEQDNELASIMDAIESVAMRGRRGLLTARLSALTKKSLEENGFIVRECDSACDQGFGEYNTISW